MLRNNYTRHRKDPEMLQNYFEVFRLMQFPKKILEIGIDQGGSLQLWHDLFNPDLLIGLDNAVVVDMSDRRIICMEYWQQDTTFTLPYRFDFITEDASHVKDLSINSLRLFWGNLKKGGVYVVEDWQHYEMEDFHAVADDLARELGAKIVKMSHLIAFIK